MILFNLASAIILILLGMRYLRKGLDRLFGSKLVEWLQKTAKNRYQAFLAGMVAGLISPSSSAIAMLSVQMLSQTALTAGRMLAVVLGANVGITVTVQLLTFNLQDFAGLFILIGGIGFLFLSRSLFKGTGQMFLGLGVIFLGMSMISNAGHLAAGNDDIRVLFLVIEHYPWIVFIGTALLALVLQSSTASIGLGIGLAQGGLVSATILVPWILGANLGIGLTMMIAGWRSVEGRRLALGSILLKSFGAILILIGGSAFASYLMALLPGGIDRQAANFNTLFNWLVGLCALPLLSFVSRALSYFIQSQTVEEQDEPGIFLDPLLLQTPSLALSQATREELRVLDHLKLMLRTVWAMRSGTHKPPISQVDEYQDRVVAIQSALKDYLGQISDENLSEKDIDWRFTLLDFSQELVIIATLIKRDLADAVTCQAHSIKQLHPEDRPELEKILGETMERMEKATVLLMTKDTRMANRFIAEKEQISIQYRSIRKRHLEQLTAGQQFDVNFFDMLNCLRRINSHLTAVAYAITRTSSARTRDDTTAAPDPDESWLTGDDSSIDRKSCAVVRTESFVN
jgi:phosphate:Na+ symporter